MDGKNDGLKSTTGPRADLWPGNAVLLVEDNPGDEDIILDMLSTNGIESSLIQRAVRLSDALKRLKKPFVKAVLLDLGLPDSTGLDTLRAVLEARPDVAVIVLTGYDNEQLGQDAISAGAMDYLVKGQITGTFLVRELRYAIERQRIKQQLRESEQFLRASMDALTAHIAIIDPSGKILFVNKAWQEFGMANDLTPALVGEGVNYLAVCDAVTGNEAEMAKNFAAGIRAVLAGDCQSFEMEYPCHSPNEQRWFIGRVNAFPGKVPRNVSIAHENITARKLAEEALLQNTRLLRIAGRTARIGGWQVDIGHNQVYWSEEVARIHEMPPGYQPTVEEGIAFYAPEWRDRIAEVFDVCAREGIPYDEEMEIITAKGRRVWIRTIGEAERDESGRIVRVHGAFMDISDRKKSEAEIVRAAQEWQRTFDSTSHAIWILDKDSRVLRANKVSEQIFPLSQGTLLGRRCFEIVHGTKHPVPDCPIFKAKKSLHRECIDLQIGDRWFEVTVDPILDERGRFDGAVHIINEITRRRRAEQEQQQLQQQLIQAQKMETIGQLAGGVAHDFNNMLGVILGNLEMALEQVDKESALYADLKEAKQAAKRSAEITRQLLTFSRKEKVKPIFINVNHAMENMLKMLKRMIGENITLEWQAGADAGTILMDTSHFNQMITNLCVNARDAIGERGTIFIKTGNCTLDDVFCAQYPDVVPGNYVSIVVQDTGCGMTQDIIAHIFEPFYTTKEHGKGTGLGLATIYGIVKQCGGCIDVDSAPGQGTTFTIYLPQVSDEVAYSHDTREYVLPSAAKGHETVLVVEDESGILRLCCSILEKSGFTVLAALSPADALKLSDNFAEDIHLVITDVIMPEINGPQLVQRIKTMRPGIKCLYMSGYTPDIIPRHKLTEQKIHCIEKPFSTQKFLAMVREILAET